MAKRPILFVSLYACSGSVNYIQRQRPGRYFLDTAVTVRNPSLQKMQKMLRQQVLKNINYQTRKFSYAYIELEK